jgi:hypothetical protein
MQPCEIRKSCPHSILSTSLLLALALLHPPIFAASLSVTLPAGSEETQIQSALDGLTLDGEVVLSAGQYEIFRPLLLRHGHQTLRGSGPATVLHLANGANCPVVVLGPPIDGPKTPASRLRLADLLIDGNRRQQKVEEWRAADDGSEINNNGVHVWNANDVTVERVICCRCRSGGLVAADVRGLRVSDFQSYDNQFDGLACYQAQDSRFDGLRLHDNLAAGISLDLGFNHNCITNAVLMSNDLGIFMRDSRDNLFQGLTIAGSRHDGVFMAQAIIPTAKGWQLVPDTQCTGNHFETLLIRDCGGTAFQVNDASCTNNTISGAVFLRNIRGGLGQPASHPVTLAQAVNH